MTEGKLESGWVAYQHRGKRVGRIKNDGTTYSTTRCPEVHLSRRHQGYGIQRSLLKELLAAKVERIEVLEFQRGAPTRRFLVAPEWWWRVGTHDVLRAEDGAQVFLSLRQLERVGLAGAA